MIALGLLVPNHDGQVVRVDVTPSFRLLSDAPMDATTLMVSLTNLRTNVETAVVQGGMFTVGDDSWQGSITGNTTALTVTLVQPINAAQLPTLQFDDIYAIEVGIGNQSFSFNFQIQSYSGINAYTYTEMLDLSAQPVGWADVTDSAAFPPVYGYTATSGAIGALFDGNDGAGASAIRHDTYGLNLVGGAFVDLEVEAGEPNAVGCCLEMFLASVGRVTVWANFRDGRLAVYNGNNAQLGNVAIRSDLPARFRLGLQTLNGTTLAYFYCNRKITQFAMPLGSPQGTTEDYIQIGSFDRSGTSGASSLIISDAKIYNGVSPLHFYNNTQIAGVSPNSISIVGDDPVIVDLNAPIDCFLGVNDGPSPLGVLDAFTTGTATTSRNHVDLEVSPAQAASTATFRNVLCGDLPNYLDLQLMVALPLGEASAGNTTPLAANMALSATASIELGVRTAVSGMSHFYAQVTDSGGTRPEADLGEVTQPDNELRLVLFNGHLDAYVNGLAAGSYNGFKVGPGFTPSVSLKASSDVGGAFTTSVDVFNHPVLAFNGTPGLLLTDAPVVVPLDATHSFTDTTTQLTFKAPPSAVTGAVDLRLYGLSIATGGAGPTSDDVFLYYGEPPAPPAPVVVKDYGLYVHDPLIYDLRVDST